MDQPLTLVSIVDQSLMLVSHVDQPLTLVSIVDQPLTLASTVDQPLMFVSTVVPYYCILSAVRKSCQRNLFSDHLLLSYLLCLCYGDITGC